MFAENTGECFKSVNTTCNIESTAVFLYRKLSLIFHISPKPQMFELHKEIDNLGWDFLCAFTLNRHKVLCLYDTDDTVRPSNPQKPGEKNGDEHNTSGGEEVEWTSLQLLGNITF